MTKYLALALLMLGWLGCGSPEVVIEDAPLPPEQAAERDQVRQRFSEMQQRIDEQRKQNMQRMMPPGQATQPQP